MSHPVTIVQAKLPLKGCKILQKGPYCKISPISFNTTASTAPRNYKARGGGHGRGLRFTRGISLMNRFSQLSSRMGITGHVSAPKESLPEHGPKPQLSFPGGICDQPLAWVWNGDVIETRA